MAELVTLLEYKEGEGLQSSKDDLQISRLITSVSQLVKTYCGNSIIDFYSVDKTETFNIDYETYAVQLTESPVVEVSLVQMRGTYREAYTTLTTAAHEYFLDEKTDSVIRTTDGSYYKNWPRGPGAVKITYKAGYSATPEDLKLAIFDLITYYLKDEHKLRQTIAGASLQNQASSSQRNNVAFPDHIKRVLDLYKNF